MNYKNTIKKLSIAMVLLLTFAACSDDDDNSNEILPTQPNIVELAIATPDLSSLVAALTAADLVDALNADGPFYRICTNKRCFCNVFK